MSADKRSVSTDALETLGTIIGPNEKRDAIHLAVLPVKAGANLKAGQYIIVVDGIAQPDHRGPGIVDPFVQNEILPGQIFWMVLKPRIIKSLRHVWSHPDFPDEPQTMGADDVMDLRRKLDSEMWVKNLCESDYRFPDYRALISAASEADGSDGDALYLGEECYGDIPPELWHHIEIITGKKISDRPTSFRCSC